MAVLVCHQQCKRVPFSPHPVQHYFSYLSSYWFCSWRLWVDEPRVWFFTGSPCNKYLGNVMFLIQKGDCRRCLVQMLLAQLGHPSSRAGSAGCQQLTAVSCIGELPLTDRTVSPGDTWDIRSASTFFTATGRCCDTKVPFAASKADFCGAIHTSELPMDQAEAGPQSKPHLSWGFLPALFHLPSWIRVLVSDSAFRGPNLSWKWTEPQQREVLSCLYGFQCKTVLC